MEFLIGLPCILAFQYVSSCLIAGEDPIECAQDLLPDNHQQQQSVQATEPKYTHRVINGKRTKVLDFT